MGLGGRNKSLSGVRHSLVTRRPCTAFLSLPSRSCPAFHARGSGSSPASRLATHSPLFRAVFRCCARQLGYPGCATRAATDVSRSCEARVAVGAGPPGHDSRTVRGSPRCRALARQARFVSVAVVVQLWIVPSSAASTLSAEASSAARRHFSIHAPGACPPSAA